MSYSRIANLIYSKKTYIFYHILFYASYYPKVGIGSEALDTLCIANRYLYVTVAIPVIINLHNHESILEGH